MCIMCTCHILQFTHAEFSIGDEVVVLILDSINKLCSKWRGPREIIKKEIVTLFHCEII